MALVLLRFIVGDAAPNVLECRQIVQAEVTSGTHQRPATRKQGCPHTTTRMSA